MNQNNTKTYPNTKNSLLLSFRLKIDKRNNWPDTAEKHVNDVYAQIELTKQYATDYQAWAQDTTGRVAAPEVPTTEELQLQYGVLDNYKAISDTLIFASARFKPLFGARSKTVAGELWGSIG